MDTLYKRLLGFTRDGVHRYSFDDGRILMANQGFVDILGLDCAPGDLVGKLLGDVLVYTEKSGTVRRLLRKEGEIHDYEYHFRTLKGVDKWVLHDSFLVTDPETNQRVVESVVRDITERKSVEEAIRQSKARLLQIIDLVPLRIFAKNMEGRFILANKCEADVYGLEPRDLHGRLHAEIHGVEDEVQRFLKDDRDVIRDGRQRVIEEEPFTDEHGNQRILHTIKIPFTTSDTAEPAVLGVAIDVTERKRAEVALREGARIEAIGNLAGGVAQNFANILSLVRGYASSITEHTIPRTSTHEDAVHIREAADHALHLTERLMSLSRSSESRGSEVKAVSLEGVVNETAELVRGQLDERATQLKVRNPKGMPYAQVDPGQLFDILVNLLLNAADAMPRGGTVTVSAAERKIVRPNLKQNPNARPGSYAVLSVSDTGTGIEKEVLDRIFDPFFTTKRMGGRFGLGLTVARNMVRSWGGWIAVRSRKGEGAAIHLYVPAAERPEELPEQGLSGEHGVLLVDDDAQLLAMMEGALASSGCRVFKTGSPQRAKRLYGQHRKEITALVVDHVVPGATKERLVHHILEKDPNAALVVTSGFCRDYVRHELPHGQWLFLQKPFSREQFLDVVQSAVRPLL